MKSTESSRTPSYTNLNSGASCATGGEDDKLYPHDEWEEDQYLRQPLLLPEPYDPENPLNGASLEIEDKPHN